MIYDLPHRKFCPFCMLTVFTPNLLSPLSGTNYVIPAMITLGKITAIPSPLRIYIRSAPEHRKKLIRHLFRDKPAGYPRPWSGSYSEVSSILSSNTLFSGKTMFAFFSCSFKYVFSFCNSLTNLRRESRVSASMFS